MALLDDILDQTLAEPQCARGWHRLIAAWNESPDDAARQRVRQRLTEFRVADARAEILRLTFLSRVTDDVRYADQAAAQVLSVEPVNPDRLAAFMAHGWLAALKHQPGRAEFVAALQRAQLPPLALRLARCAAAWRPATLAPRLPRRIERVAIVCPYVGDAIHTPSVMTASQCEVLVRAGCRVHVFACQELQPPETDMYRGDASRVVLASFDPDYWRHALPQGASLSYSDVRLSLAQRCRDMLPKIIDFDPDAVLLIGLYSALAAALHAVRPVVGLNVHSLPPLAPVDVWLSADEPGTAHPLAGWHGAFAAPLAHFHPYRMKRPLGHWPLTRADLGLADDALVWLTVGFRLEAEVSGPWAAQMLELLARTPGAVWLLVGGAGRLPAALAQAPAGQVRTWPTRADIAAVMHLADIYVNPPGMGGGFSVAEAMAVGLPALSLADSDGGDKVGELALADPAAYVERLAALCASRALRAEMGGQLSARFAERFDLAASGASLLAAFAAAADAAAPRLSACE